MAQPNNGLQTIVIFRVVAPQAGLEPATLRLTAGCSAIELLRKIGGRGIWRYRTSTRTRIVMVPNREWGVKPCNPQTGHRLERLNEKKIDAAPDHRAQ